MTIAFGLLLFVGYLSGSVPFGKIVGKYHKIDIQKHGSGNIGFANSVRVLGWKAGMIVLVGDVLKGYIPVLIAKHYLGLDQTLVVALIAIIGHIFPVWLKFRGGKGIATGLGVTLGLVPAVGLLGLLVYLLGFAVLRKSAPCSIIAAWSLPLLCLALYPRYDLFYLGLALLASWTHRNNLKLMFGRN